MVCAQGRHTVTGSIPFCGREQQPWAADYAAFARAVWEPARLFEAAFAAGVRRADTLAPVAPIVVALDNTSAKKSSRVIAAARWLRRAAADKSQRRIPNK